MKAALVAAFFVARRSHERRLNGGVWEHSNGLSHCSAKLSLGRSKMLKLSLVMMFVLSLATLSFASSLMPTPAHEEAAAAAVAGGPLWVRTFE
jgi:hypothetical protein